MLIARHFSENMPPLHREEMAKDIYHSTVKIALEKDSWKITDDPLTLKLVGRSAFVDLGVEKLFAAEKEGKRIAVEVKSFISSSPIKDLEQALRQYIMYSQVLERQKFNRLLYLAIPQSGVFGFFQQRNCRN